MLMVLWEEGGCVSGISDWTFAGGGIEYIFRDWREAYCLRGEQEQKTLCLACLGCTAGVDRSKDECRRQILVDNQLELARAYSTKVFPLRSAPFNEFRPAVILAMF